MKANIKGFIFEVTVNGSLKCDEYSGNRIKHDIDRQNDNEEQLKGLDLTFGASVKTGAEEYQGEVDLREFADAIKTAIDTNIKKQVEEQLDRQMETRDKQYNYDMKRTEEQLKDLRNNKANK